MDFIAGQFNEQVDKTIMEAKGEIEAFYQDKVNLFANAALVEHKEDLVKFANPVNDSMLT